MNNNRINQKQERLLICLSSSPTNARIIQFAGKMAEAYQGTLTALFVETSSYSKMKKEDRERLQMNIRLARSFGAEIAQEKGEDIASQIAEYARLNGITKIIIGQSSSSQRRSGKKSLSDKLLEYTPKMDILIIPDGLADAAQQLKYRKSTEQFLNLPDVIKMLLSLVTATVLSLIFYRLGFTDANIIPVYLLGVLLTSIMTEHMFYSVLASFVSVITFNFFFTDPRYTLLAYDIGYPMTFLVMFLASLITGTLAGKLKLLARQSSERAYRTQILLDTNQALQQADNEEEILKTAMDQLTKLTGRMARVIPASNPVPASDREKKEAEQERKRTFPLLIGKDLYGNVEIDVSDTPMDVFENSIVLSILGECAMALENEKNAREKEETAILAKNEQLRANLLRTISHDLRTPLTSISGNASNLMHQADEFSPEVRQQLYLDIYDDSQWLINLVENLLSVTRMEGQGIRLRQTPELLADLVAEAMKHLDRRAPEHEIHMTEEDEFLLVRVDAKLIIQVLINLLNNAVKYTPEGSEIEVHIKRDGEMAQITVSDNGPGIPDERKEQVFEMFYTGESNIADGRRSMGLGLALCRSIISAHNGAISLKDSPTGGAAFIFTLPIEEVQLHD